MIGGANPLIKNLPLTLANFSDVLLFRYLVLLILSIVINLRDLS